jgi:thiol-disulfide isomerase/thioredoxin
VLPVPASEAAGHGAAAAEAGGTCPLASAAPSAAARVGATWHEGATGYDVARREQGATRAPMVVYFRTDWCGYCRRFEGGLLDRPATQAYLGARAVKVRVNPETGPREAALAERFGVEGFPTFLVVAGDAPEEISPFVDEGLRIRVLTPGEFEAAVEGVIAARVTAGLARSEALLGGGDPAAAVALLDDLIGLDPRRAETYFRRGLAHGALRARERAFADFRRAVELKPDFPEVYRSTDQWLARDGRWDEIIDCWSDYLGRAPRSAAGYLERGDAYRRKGDRDRARADAETACQLGESRGCDAARRL